jgi:polyisoprenyl-phosphate glycosyltransferase
MKNETNLVLSVITPAFNEELNLPLFYEQIKATLDPAGLKWEWIVVDDHSTDDTFAAVQALAQADSRVRGLRLARNAGSHTAITCGLRLAAGAGAVVMAVDLQDPPETILPLVEKWRAGAQVVWAVRAGREGETAAKLGFSRLYYALMRHVVGLKDMPGNGADFFLVDRRVIAALQEFPETNVSIFALLTWMGFRQDRLTYVKEARLHGQSGWSLQKKIKLAVDSVTSFSYLPIRVMSGAGVAMSAIGFLYALFVIAHALFGKPVAGWSSLMAVVLVVGGIQLLMMGVLGEYLWRALDESRRRPRYQIEADTAALKG